MRLPTLLGLSLLLTASACSTGSTQAGGGTPANGNQQATQPNVTTGATNGNTPAPAGNANAVTNDVPKLAAVCDTQSAADVTLTVNTQAGPQGASQPIALSNKMWSMNIDSADPEDYTPTLSSTYVSFLKGLKPAMLRWPDGVHSQQVTFSTTGSGSNVLTPDFVDHFIALCRAVGAEPLLGINATSSGSAQAAANLVRYVNVTKGYKVRYFHIGNEPDNGEDSAVTAASYAQTFQSYRSAMLAVDPNIFLVGAELMTGGSIMGYSPYTDWLTPILQDTAQTPMDAVAWHFYPKDSSNTSSSSSAYASPANLLLESASDWPPAGMNFSSIVMPKIQTLLRQYAPKAEVWIDEIAEDSGQANGMGTANIAASPLWAADEISRYAEYGASAAFRFIFKVGDNAHGYTMLDANNVPRPDYYAYWLLAQQFGDALVASQSSNQSNVAVHAAKRSADGTLRVMLINKTNTVQKAQLKLTGFVPTASARYLLAGTSLTATSVTLNGNQLTAANIGNGNDAISWVGTPDACTNNVLVLPPASLMLLAFAGP